MSVLVVKGSYIDAAGDEQQVLFSTHPWRDEELGDALPRISAGSDPEYRSVVTFPSMGGRGSLSYGSIEIINLDGEFDDWIGGEFHGRRWDIRRGEAYESWDELDPQFIARVKQIDFLGSAKVRIMFRNAMELLGNPVQINEYPPDLPNPDLRESLKPTMVGLCEHVPTDLIDAISSSEERFYVADTFNGTLWTSGVNGGCKEGLATIPLGTNAGEYQEWERGFDVKKHATLPLTGLFVKGPRKRLIHWLSAHFAQWTDGSLGEIPDDPWLLGGHNAAGVRELTRYENTDSIRVFHDDGLVALNLRYDVEDVLEAGKDYVFRVWTAPVEGWSNRMRYRLAAWGDVGSTVIQTNTNIDAADGTLHEIQFNNNADAAKTKFWFQFRQHPDDEAARLPSEIRILRVQLLPVVESGNGSGVGIMTRASEIVPYLLLERGKRMFDLPPDFEQGPLHPTQIHYEALDVVTGEFPGLLMGWWWKDETTHADLLDLILTKTHNAGWRFDRQDRLTAAVQREPESYMGEPVAAPVWDEGTHVYERLPDPVLNPQTSWSIEPFPVVDGDLILMLVMGSHQNPDISIASFEATGFSFLHQSVSEGITVTVLYKVSTGVEPVNYTVRALAGAASSIHSIFLSRVTGADRVNPLSNYSAASGAGDSGVQLPSTTVEMDHSLVVSAALGMDDMFWTAIPDEVLFTSAPNPGIAIGGSPYMQGDTGDKDFAWVGTVDSVVAVMFVVNPASVAEAEIFTDRFEMVRNSLQVEEYGAPELTTRMGTRRNFRPMGEGEVAELNVHDYMRARYRREWVNVQGVSDAIANLLPDAYSHARSAKLRETAIGPASSGAILPLRADVQFHSKLRRWVIHHRVTHDGGTIDGGEPGMLTHPRFDLDEGKMYIAVDTRHLRSRIEIRGLY